MSNRELGQRYGQALLDITEAAGKTARVRQDLASFEKAIRGSAELARFLADPTIAVPARRNVVAEIAKRGLFDGVTSDFLCVLADNRRLGVFRDIVEAFDRLADERQGVVRAVAEAATELSPDQTTRLRQVLEKRTGRKVRLEIRVNPELIGGLRVEVAGTSLDGSLSSRLDGLRQSILQQF